MRFFGFCLFPTVVQKYFCFFGVSTPAPHVSSRETEFWESTKLWLRGKKDGVDSGWRKWLYRKLTFLIDTIFYIVTFLGGNIFVTFLIDIIFFLVIFLSWQYFLHTFLIDTIFYIVNFLGGNIFVTFLIDIIFFLVIFLSDNIVYTLSWLTFFFFRPFP